MAGGPGEAAILDTPFLVDAGINRNRDVVIMDQRGTLYDDPDLNCPEIDRFYARQVSLVYDAPSTGKAQAAAAAACRRRLVNNGVNLSAYNTTENAQDFVDLRRVLGIRQWNVYGYSYGTDLALSLMRDHPDGIRTVIIDSVLPPDVVNLPFTWKSAREGITTIFGDCQTQPACARKYPHLLATFTQQVNRLEKHPIVRNVVPPQGGRAVKVVLDGGTILNMLVGNNPKPPDVPRAIVQLAAGNPRLFLEARRAAANVSAVPEQALGMTQSIACREWTPYGSQAAILRAGRDVFPTLPASVLANAPQMPFEHELPGVERSDGSAIAAHSRPQQHPHVSRHGRHRLENGRAAGAVRSRRFAELNVRRHQEHRPLGDRAVALRTADLCVVSCTPAIAEHGVRRNRARSGV